MFQLVSHVLSVQTSIVQHLTILDVRLVQVSSTALLVLQTAKFLCGI